MPTSSRKRSTAKDDTDRLALVRESAELAHVHYVRQGDPKGSATRCSARPSTWATQPFAVLLGDDLIDAERPAADPDDRGPGAATAAASSR